MIHISHPRKDLVDIIKLFEFPMNDYDHLTKLQLSKVLWKQVNRKKKIKPDDEYFFVEDIKDLKRYLEKASPRQSFPVKTQDDIYEKTRNVIFYCKECSFSLVASTYNDTDEVIADATFISCWGDNPSVRRALRLLKEDPKLQKTDIPIPTITQKCQKRLSRLKEIKRLNVCGLKVTHGSFLVEFP
jgi:hypothetical protein